MSKNKHLTFDDRCVIERELDKRSSFKALGITTGKDCTTISKEIRSHLVFEKKGAPYRKRKNVPFPDLAEMPVRTTKKRNAFFYASLLMSATAALAKMSVHSKNIFTVLYLRRKNTKKYAVNPAPASTLQVYARRGVFLRKNLTS